MTILREENMRLREENLDMREERLFNKRHASAPFAAHSLNLGLGLKEGQSTTDLDTENTYAGQGGLDGSGVEQLTGRTQPSSGTTSARVEHAHSEDTAIAPQPIQSSDLPEHQDADTSITGHGTSTVAVRSHSCQLPGWQQTGSALTTMEVPPNPPPTGNRLSSDGGASSSATGTFSVTVETIETSYLTAPWRQSSDTTLQPYGTRSPPSQLRSPPSQVRSPTSQVRLLASPQISNQSRTLSPQVSGRTLSPPMTTRQASASTSAVSSVCSNCQRALSPTDHQRITTLAVPPRTLSPDRQITTPAVPQSQTTNQYRAQSPTYRTQSPSYRAQSPSQSQQLTAMAPSVSAIRVPATLPTPRNITAQPQTGIPRPATWRPRWWANPAGENGVE